MIDTDASAYAAGAIILQQQDKEDPTSWAIFGYWSKTLTNEHSNYFATERECYAVVGPRSPCDATSREHGSWYETTIMHYDG